MTKKARELKRGDVTVMGRVLDKCTFKTLGGAHKLAIICEGGQWFACESGDELELVQVEQPTVPAGRVRRGMEIWTSSGAVRIARTYGDDERNVCLVGTHMDSRAPYWEICERDVHFEVIL